MSEGTSGERRLDAAEVFDENRGLLVSVAYRILGSVTDAEDAVQEALLAATVQWPADGVPENPRGWLLTVAARRHTDMVRAEVSRRRRELKAPEPSPSAVQTDDTLTLLFLCCHPALTEASQVALTLRAVGGLTHHHPASLDAVLPQCGQQAPQEAVQAAGLVGEPAHPHQEGADPALYRVPVRRRTHDASASPCPNGARVTSGRRRESRKARACARMAGAIERSTSRSPAPSATAARTTPGLQRSPTASWYSSRRRRTEGRRDITT